MDEVGQQLAAAVQLHQAGRLAEAEARYRAILQQTPDNPHALHLLGLIAYQQRRHPEAEGLIARALAIHGSHPIFHSNLAAVYLELDRLDDTIAHAREALRLDPTIANAHNNLGVALMRRGRYDEAEQAFAAAVRLDPRHIDARCNLGAALHRQGRLGEALTCLEQTVRLAPGHAQAQNDLGGVLLACDQAERAAGYFREALGLRPGFAEALSNLGLALRELGRVDEAMACFREALRLNPAYAGARNNLAYTLEFQGQFAAAQAEFAEALRLDPDNARALAGLSGLAAAGHYPLSEDELRRVRALVQRRDLPLDDLGRLHFAVARHLDKAGDYDTAFAHYRQGNELAKEYVRRRGVAFDAAAQHAQIDRLIAAFSPAYFGHVRGFGVDSELPVFVVGMMRSGTTLAEQILASHPLVHGAGELRDFGQLTTTLAQQLGTAEPFPECVARLDRAAVQTLAQRHLERLRQLGGKAARVVDKMPFNFLHLGLIATLFPRTRIIHCRRDPVDTCLSCYMQNFGEPQGFTLDLHDLGVYYREYERLMEYWRRVLPVPMFELQYEALTAEPEVVSRRLIEYCGLAWDERCLRFHETERPVRTASMLQVRQPMYRSAVGRWKRYEQHLGPLLAALASRAP
jgi:tetratricopeptide (TPR) repeat protein